MTSVTPILVSGNIRDNTATVSFLGSILEKVSAAQERPFSLDKASMLQLIERRGGIGSEKPSLSQPDSNYKVVRFESDKDKIVLTDDSHKDRIPRMPYKKKEKPRIRFKEVAVTGEAINRQVLYRPSLPKVSMFSSSFSSDYNASIRFKISRHGFVENPECIVSCGSSDIDQMAIRYIRRWQFVPQDVEAQEGIIRIRFEGT